MRVWLVFSMVFRSGSYFWYGIEEGWRYRLVFRLCLIFLFYIVCLLNVFSVNSCFLWRVRFFFGLYNLGYVGFYRIIMRRGFYNGKTGFFFESESGKN